MLPFKKIDNNDHRASLRRKTFFLSICYPIIRYETANQALSLVVESRSLFFYRLYNFIFCVLLHLFLSFACLFVCHLIYQFIKRTMTDRYLAEQVFSYFGLVFWSLQLAPQGIIFSFSVISSPRLNLPFLFSMEDI